MSFIYECVIFRIDNNYTVRLFERFRFQSYVSWTQGSNPLQFAVDAANGVRQLSVTFNFSNSVFLAYWESYSVVLLDEYLQPNVTCT